MAIICPNCHQELEEEGNFCFHCGYPLKDDQPEIVEINLKKEIEESDLREELTRVGRHQGRKKRGLMWSWQRVVGVMLVLSAILLLGLNYQFNYSVARVEDHFRKGLRFENYERAARVTSSPLAKKAWGAEDVKRMVENYQQAGIELLQLVMGTSNGELIQTEAGLIAEVERKGSYLLIFPIYKMMIQPLPVHLSVPNHYRDIVLKVPGQEPQPLTADQALMIEPRASEIEIEYSVDGQVESVRLELNYEDLLEGRHRINLIPITNQLKMEPASLGIRPNLEFELLGVEIDGQLYEEDIINLSGYVGQVFVVKLFAVYNGVPIESSIQEVALIESSELLLDFLEDDNFQRQVRQAEQNNENQ